MSNIGLWIKQKQINLTNHINADQQPSRHCRFKTRQSKSLLWKQSCISKHYTKNTGRCSHRDSIECCKCVTTIFGRQLNLFKKIKRLCQGTCLPMVVLIKSVTCQLVLLEYWLLIRLFWGGPTVIGQ